MELAFLSTFVAVLVFCVIIDVSIVLPMLLGLVLFFVYALIKGNSFKSVFFMALSGVKTVRNILITFVLIGVLTALWRAGGTIPAIVCYSLKVINPSAFIMLGFILNCLISFLTGTAFGTAATMGSITMTVAYSMGINPVICGGAVLAGCYFGDRFSPVSTSALLVSEITGTDLYSNLKNMLKSTVVPFVLSCALYLILGIVSGGSGSDIPDVTGMFSKQFTISPIAVIPAAIILVLALFRVNVKISMLCSCISSVFICLFLQDVSISEILKFSVLGYKTSVSELSAIINGGGIVSMIKVMSIVCISSCYSGIFNGTGMLNSIMDLVSKMHSKLSSFTVTLLVSLFTSAFACNQTLSIMLTNQLCAHLEHDKNRFAHFLENSAVVISPLIPWSIAGTVTLSSAGAPMTGMALAVFLYILPVYSLLYFKHKHI